MIAQYPVYLVIEDGATGGVRKTANVKECEFCFALIREEKLDDHISRTHP